MKFRIRALALGASLALLGGCALDGDTGAKGADGATGPAGANGSDGLNGANGAGQVIAIGRIGRTTPGGFNVGAAEIVEYDATNHRIFTVNAQAGGVDVFPASDFTALAAPAQQLNLKQMLVDQGIVASTALVGGANSLAQGNGLVAVAVEANPKTGNGWVVFLNAATLAYVRAVPVGALPDMVTFTPDGSRVLVANEGEPDAGYLNDPEGSVSVITVATGAVATIGFADFNAGGPRAAELPAKERMVRPYGSASVAQDLEPEYITVSADGSRAWVSLQENNAIAVLDLANNTVEKIFGLGFKDFSIPGNEFDASTQDGVNLRTWPVLGMYMPDTLASFRYNGRDYLVTANEGDDREDWLAPITDRASCEAAGFLLRGGACSDRLELRNVSVANTPYVTLGAALAGLNTDSTLGRLRVSYSTTYRMNGGSISAGVPSVVALNRLYAYGGRSFAIWDAATGEPVFDSGNAFERLTALRYGSLFNQDHNGNASGDARSNSKGPEPEALALGVINGHTYAFIGLERMGGIMVYDLSNPFAPQFVQYVNDRDVTVTANAANVAARAMDLGPESIRFVPANANPRGKPLLVVGSEVSGTTSVYEVAITALQQ